MTWGSTEEKLNYLAQRDSWPTDEELCRLEHFGRRDEPLNEWEPDEASAEYQDWLRNR